MLKKKKDQHFYCETNSVFPLRRHLSGDCHCPDPVVQRCVLCHSSEINSLVQQWKLSGQMLRGDVCS